MSKTSLVAKQVRLQQWANDIRDCNNRPHGSTVEQWCENHGIKKNTYYWRMKAVRKACLDIVGDEFVSSQNTAIDVSAGFVELHPIKEDQRKSSPVILNIGKARMELPENISDEFLFRIMEAASHA